MEKSFDIIVIGAGIIGAACALEAASQGLKVFLIDRGDFGSETSSSSYKIIHGGLRYLQHFHLSRLKESYKAQRYVRIAAPHLHKPLPFLVPCYGYGIKGRAALNIACGMYEFLSNDRNDGVPEHLHLPNHKILSKEDTLKIAPHLNSKSLKGSVVFYDCQMLNPDRLTLAVVQAAQEKGVLVKNYTELVRIKTKTANSGNPEITELLLKDKINNVEYRASAKFYINAIGPSVDQIGHLFEDKGVLSGSIPEQILSKGFQVVLPKVVDSYAISVESKGIDSASNISRGGRAHFLQPWKGHTLIGTTDTIYKGDPKNFKISLNEIREFVNEIHEAYPSEMLKPMNVLFAYGGLRPVDGVIKKDIEKGVNRDGMVNTSREEEIIDHSITSWAGLRKINNLLTVGGIKYTTFRAVAERALALINKKKIADYTFNIKSGLTESQNLVIGGVLPDYNSLLGVCLEQGFKCKEVELKDLLECYGGLTKQVLYKTIENQNKYMLESTKAILFTRVEFAVKYEFARKLSDIMIRRIPLSVFGFPGYTLVDEISKFAAHFLGWDEIQRQKEIEEYSAKFTFEL